jgi:hypothetical protein
VANGGGGRASAPPLHLLPAGHSTLARDPDRRSLPLMTAHDVIEQIKALPPEERAMVVGFIQKLETTKPRGAVYADDKAFDDAAKWVFQEHAELMKKLSQ